MDESVRTSLVSSLYGPGTTVCWLLTIGSVIITWCFNVESQKVDSITNDLITVLTLPCVAAVHLIYQISTFPGSGRELLTSNDENVLAFAAAMEAPLNICETFCAFSLVLLAIAILSARPKRSFCIVAVGLLSFSTEMVLFVKAFGVTAGASNLARPFIFNFAWGIAVVWIFLVSLLGLNIMVWNFGPLPQSGVAHRPGQDATTTSISKRTHERAQRTREFNFMLLLSVPLLFLGLSASGGGVLELTPYQTVLDTWGRLLYFIPVSASSLRDLDQAVALGAGIVVLLMSIYEAFKAEKTTLEKEVIEEMQEFKACKRELREIRAMMETAADGPTREGLQRRQNALVFKMSYI